MEDIEHYDIPVYNFPYDIEEDDEETVQDNSELRVCGNILSEFTDPLNCRHIGPPSFCDHWFGGRN